LNLTDGNLATHVKALEEAGYLLVKKEFIGRKPNTLYSVTADGRKAFEQHLSVLEQFIKNS
jgi:DNA-binding MarR family transcriptional regulator